MAVVSGERHRVVCCGRRFCISIGGRVKVIFLFLYYRRLRIFTRGNIALQAIESKHSICCGVLDILSCV